MNLKVSQTTTPPSSEDLSTTYKRLASHLALPSLHTIVRRGGREPAQGGWGVGKGKLGEEEVAVLNIIDCFIIYTPRAVGLFIHTNPPANCCFHATNSPSTRLL